MSPSHSDDHVDEGDPRRWLILAVLCLALSIIIIDETVLNVAIPALFRQLGASSSEVQWAIDAYVLVYAALLFPFGNLGDRYGRRTFLLAGLAVFGASSAVAAWAPNPAVLIASRSVMAVGGAMIMPQTLSILVEVFSNAQRSIAIAVWSSVSGIGILLGPIMGGWLVEHYWWGSVFLINIPIVAVAVVGTLVLLPNHRDPIASPSDPLGTVLAILALSGMLYAVIEAPGRGWTSPMILLTGIGGVVAAVVFVFVELHIEHPMLDVRVLVNPVIAQSCLVIMAVFLTLQGTAYAMTQYLQLIQGRGALATGMVYAPTTIGWSLSALLSTVVVRRFGHQAVLGLALVVLALSFLPLAALGDSTGLATILVVFSVQGVAMGLSMTPVTDLVMGALPRARSGIASAINDATRQVGGAIGVAVLGSVLVTGFQRDVNAAGIGGVVDNLAAGLDSGNPAVIAASRGAFVTGFQWVMLISFIVVILSAAVILVSRGLRAPRVVHATSTLDL